MEDTQIPPIPLPPPRKTVRPSHFYLPEILRVPDLEDLLGVSKATVLHWVADGKLKPAAKEGGRWSTFYTSDILRIIRNAVSLDLVNRFDLMRPRSGDKTMTAFSNHEKD